MAARRVLSAILLFILLGLTHLAAFADDSSSSEGTRGEDKEDVDSWPRVEAESQTCDDDVRPGEIDGQPFPYPVNDILKELAFPFPNRKKKPSLPNLVVIVTDDQDDFILDVNRTMPQTKRLILDRGVHFARAFANTPVCCPSRATLFAGRYPHSPGMTKSNRENCGGKDWRAGPELDTVAVRLQQKGYRTMFAGKYLNTYGMGDPMPSQIPPGWSEWYALVGNSRFWNYSVSDEGFEVRYGSISGANDYLTDSLARRAVHFIRRSNGDQPFLVWIAPPAAHAPFSPAIRHSNSWTGVQLPLSASFNASGEGKHEPVSLAKPLTSDQERELGKMYRMRGETLQSVDDLVVTIFAALRDKNIENDTFIIFTSDNGFHLGSFRLPFDKRQPYETDIRIPFIVYGPGVQRGISRNEYIAHVDLAPTLLDLANAPIPLDWDGRSFKDLLFEPPGSGRLGGELVLIEYDGEADPLSMGNLYCGAGHTTFDELGRARAAGQFRPSLCDSWNNTYSCLRGPRLLPLVKHEFLFCQFECYTFITSKSWPFRRGVKTKVPCPARSPGALGEFYDLERDPAQLTNRIKSLPILVKEALMYKLLLMRTCRGALSCSQARRGFIELGAMPEHHQDAQTHSIIT